MLLVLARAPVARRQHCGKARAFLRANQRLLPPQVPVVELLPCSSSTPAGLKRQFHDRPAYLYAWNLGFLTFLGLPSIRMLDKTPNFLQTQTPGLISHAAY